MKKYVIRNIGWVFDDDWYNFDGEISLEGIYDSKAAALHKTKQLNYLYFLYHLPYLSRFQLTFQYNSIERKEEFVNIEKIKSVLANKLNQKPAELFNNYNRGIQRDKKHLLKNISLEEITDLLKLVKLDFFTVLEINADEPFLFHFKKNPNLWSSFFNKDYHYNEDFYFYFYDTSDSDAKRKVNTILECYELALIKDDTESSIFWNLVNDILVEGELSELSETPIILESIIRNSKNIKYDAELKILEFKEEITAIELMSLDSVLIQPILIAEKVNIKSLNKMSHLFVQNSVEDEYGVKIF